MTDTILSEQIYLSRDSIRELIIDGIVKERFGFGYFSYNLLIRAWERTFYDKKAHPTVTKVKKYINDLTNLELFELYTNICLEEFNQRRKNDKINR